MSDAEDTSPETPSLSAVFNAVVREAVLDFPQLRGKFIIVDLDAGSIHGVPDLAATNFGSVEEVEQAINEAAQSAFESNTSTSAYLPEHDLRIIFYNSAGVQTMGASGATVENALGVVDHELGHLVVNGGLAGATMTEEINAETEADLMSALRRARRSGSNDREGINLLAFNRAYALVTEGGEDAVRHFTSFALMELAQMCDATDLSKLRPEMSAGMAEMLARQYAVPEQDASRLRDAFAPAAAARKSGDAETVARRIAEVTLAPGAAEDVFRLGSFVLSYYLDAKISVHGKPLVLQGDDWDGVRAELKARAEKPAAPGLIILPKGPNASPSF